MLVVGGQVVISQLVAVEPLLAADAKALENRKGEARKASDVNFVGVEAGGSAYSVVVHSM